MNGRTDGRTNNNVAKLSRSEFVGKASISERERKLCQHLLKFPVILRCSCAKKGKEMYRVVQSTCRSIAFKHLLFLLEIQKAGTTVTYYIGGR